MSSPAPGYYFQAHLTGAWQRLPAARPHQHPQAAATDYALSVAQKIAGATQLSQADLAEAQTNSHLGRPVDLPNLPVRLLWARIRLTADAQQAAHVDQLLRERHQAEHDARQDHRRLQRATDLRDALLTDPSLAFAYWFLDHPEAVDEATVQHVERLITAAASYAPGTTWVQVARILQDFVLTLPDDSRQHLITSLAHIFDRYGQPQRAQQLRTAGQTSPSSPSTAPSSGPSQAAL
ncbi:hypothetical protein [Streptomyces montanisoli]|uniref:Uncharacterized protein n=1 Tax=Streptomyces montanisoli TaxID=2798581 RepID=A0A940MEQ9_9ACTN|nr:hypothetical protein [Streptomyces montanisoli]MBP0458981.1 hypothetical protein [Streptomyces montanisoli]